MSRNEERVRGLIAEEAADWFVQNRDGLGVEQRRQFIAWLKSSPAHVEEYIAVTALAQDLPAASERTGETRAQTVALALRDDDSTFQSLRPPLISTRNRAVGLRRWQTHAVAAALALLSVAMGFRVLTGYWSDHLPTPSDELAALHFQSRHGELQTHELADHSVIHLNTDTTVTVRFSDKERLVVLEAGEADFEVAHEAHRAFRVSAGPAQVTDLGTQFDVRLGQAATVVTVTDGRVNVGLTANFKHTAQTLQLIGGQQIRVAEGDWPAQPAAVNSERTTAWLHRQIKFENEPLSRVTSEFNRYASTPFEIVTPALRDLKISGVFATDDSETFIAFLRSFKGVHVEVTATRILVSQH